MKSIKLLLILLAFGSCSSTDQKVNHNDQIPFITSFDDLGPRFFNNSDTTYLVNFWATSCPPCIKEMPLFKQLEELKAREAFKVLLVSLDLPRDYESRVIPFVEKHEIKPEVVHLADENYTYWTEKIDSSWFGALPATMVVKNDKKVFHFGGMTEYTEVDSLVRLIN